jgi:sugar transferase (PEP-CTERM/EpsH1 system associated)
MRAFVAKARARGLAAEVVISSAMAQYVAEPSGAPRIVDFCDSDAEKWRAYAQGASGPMRALYALEARRLAAAETAIANWADAAFAASEAEAAIFNAREGIVRKVLWFGNGVETDEFSPRKDYPRPADAGEVVFVGVMDYRPNVEGVLWFTDDVWPRVRLDAPGARFAIVGARPVRRVRALAGRDGVNVTGAVADVRPFLTHARVAVAPLAIARGVANKVIEAMAMGLPVVMTEAANCGVGARVGEAVVATGAEAFAEAVAGLLRDPVRAQAIGAAARARMTADFSWERRLAPFEEAVERAASE